VNYLRLQNKGNLEVKLVCTFGYRFRWIEKIDSFFGNLHPIIYGDRPIVIQGAGAGSAVTARGVFGASLSDS
jgi:aspartokinase/homoserine dehydrogenase 1